MNLDNNAVLEQQNQRKQTAVITGEAEGDRESDADVSTNPPLTPQANSAIF